MSRIKLSALALALACGSGFTPWTAPTIADRHDADPHKPRPRSKGEKARNRKNRP